MSVFNEISELVPGVQDGMLMDTAMVLIRDRLLELERKIQSAKAAMKYAYEDHSDQYYLNVLEDLEK